MDPLIVSSIVAAIPATMAAVAAFRAATRNEKQLTPSNGHTIAQMVEELWNELTDAKADINHAEDDREAIRQDLAAHDHRLQELSDDFQQHWRTGICPECLKPISMPVDPDVGGHPI